MKKVKKTKLAQRVARKEKFRILPTHIFVAIFIAIVALTFKNQASTPKTSQKPKTIYNPIQAAPTQIYNTSDYPSPTLGKAFEEKIIWIQYNGAYDNVVYSYEIRDEYPINARRKWLAMDGIATPGHNLGNAGWEVPRGDLYSMLTTHKIGESFVLNDSDNKPHTHIRLPDRSIDGIQFLIFKTDDNASGFDHATRYYAVFQKNGDTGLVSFEYEDILYKDVFNHMLDSFTFSMREGKTFHQVRGTYLHDDVQDFYDKQDQK